MVSALEPVDLRREGFAQDRDGGTGKNIEQNRRKGNAKREKKGESANASNRNADAKKKRTRVDKYCARNGSSSRDTDLTCGKDPERNSLLSA